MSEHWTGLGDLTLSACGFLAERTLVFGGPGKDASGASPGAQLPKDLHHPCGPVINHLSQAALPVSNLDLCLPPPTSKLTIGPL